MYLARVDPTLVPFRFSDAKLPMTERILPSSAFAAVHGQDPCRHRGAATCRTIWPICCVHRLNPQLKRPPQILRQTGRRRIPTAAICDLPGRQTPSLWQQSTTLIQSGNQKKINDLVDAKVPPYFNFSRMTALAMGRNWPRANAEQQKTLTGEFRNLLMRTYSSALSTYKNQVIEFKPLRATAGDADVTVKTQVKQAGTEPISIDYSMEKTPAGWKVYDVVIGGVGLVTNYRETFNTEISKAAWTV